jgi:hypothetical protein
MKRFLILAIVAALSLAVAPRAFAIRPFKVQFEKRYVKKDSVDPKDVAFKELVQKAGCAVCHVGEERKNRNGYGGALDPLLDHEADKDDAAKIRAALEKVEGLRSDPKDLNSPTFGELIKQGKLPAGE